MRRRRHQPVSKQGKWLRQVVAGFFEYHAVPTNSRALNRFRHHVTDLWRRSLQRRSQKDRITWHRIKKLADDFLPRARVLHPWPLARFAVKHPRWEPSALIGHARIWCGRRLAISVPTAIIWFGLSGTGHWLKHSTSRLLVLQQFDIQSATGINQFSPPTSMPCPA